MMMFKLRTAPGQWIPATTALGCLCVLALAERVWPLRSEREAKARRWARNFTLAACGLAVQALERGLSQRAAKAQLRRRSPSRAVEEARPVEALLGLLALDYTLYLWHVLTHEVPYLWRYHAVHHADRDLDVTTALRFHMTELAWSIPWRVAQVGLFGVTPQVLSWWQTALTASVLFQHSNLRLPARWDRRLSWLLVTPRLHGIHHSSDGNERSCNWSSGLTLWDRLHGTFRDDSIQEEIQIGLAEAQQPSDVSIGKLFLPSVLLHETER